MIPATAHAAGHRRSRDLRSHSWARRGTDGDVYAGIARAWWSMHQAGEHHDHLMRPFLVRPGFADDVWGESKVDPDDVMEVCAMLVVFEDFRVRECATPTQKCDGLTEGLDPTGGWWYPLTKAPQLGVHFWQLVLVPVELCCIGPVDDPSPLRQGRFTVRAPITNRACL